MATTRISPFPATQWTAVVDVCRLGGPTQQRRAIESICKDYWFPLYAYARRAGNQPSDAEDLTQGFFHYLIGRNLVSGANPELGKLRTFLLTAFQRFIGDIRTRNNALKRGGGLEILSLDVDAAERTFGEPPERLTPHQIFDRNWALSIIQRTISELAETEAISGRAAQFKLLQDFINPRTHAEGSYEEAASALELSIESTRKAVSRLRGRFRDLLRKQIAATMSNPDDLQIDEELMALKLALRS
ncbi:hypothetical protein JIN85_02775 [Luteolibacter pohnpeiensis]|uniref:RNA polymerase subunit sigma-24 n=1 Tax=Luteolibacter pohnpeiensis TaxID=454153 RepID=A0A934S2N4_9BACT|nr:hypothetical protein [Luteolibacter pohnpeiensis]MBK1881321.1 hypothetical protein [Luteolibacter pohnpeiensis]